MRKLAFYYQVFLCLFFTSLLTVKDVHAQTPPTKFFVDSSSMGIPTGMTWATPFLTIQDALNVADKGDTICVAKGTYYPDEGPGQTADAKTSTFDISSEVLLVGGFPSGGGPFSTRDYISNPTILSGDINQSGDTIGNAYHVVTFDKVNMGTEVNGFTITMGNATTNGAFRFCGAGILNIVRMANDSTCPSIVYCQITNNFALTGAGMYNLAENGGVNRVDLFGCTFDQNQATTRDGGALVNIANNGEMAYELDSCTLSNNQAELAGGAIIDIGIDTGFVNSDIDNTIFSENSATADGGAISYRFDRGSMNAQINQTQFEKNTSGVSGGAIILFSNDSTNNCSVTIDSSRFADNEGNGRGGAFYFKSERGNNSLSIHQTTFTKNYSQANGGALCLESIQVTSDFTFDLDSCRFIQDSAKSSAGAIYLESVFAQATGSINLCVFESNKGNNGGAIAGIVAVANSSLSLTTDSCTFIENQAKDSGGATFYHANSGEISHQVTCSQFTENASVNSGGALSATANTAAAMITIDMDSVRFENNQSKNSGGGAIRYNTVFGQIGGDINDCLFKGNVAGGSGGAIESSANELSARYSANIDSCSFMQNSAGFDGGAIYYSAGNGDLSGQVTNSHFQYNKTLYSGAGMLVITTQDSADLTTEIMNCTFSDNRCIYGGGIAFLNYGGHLYPSISQCLFYQDTAEYSGAIDMYGANGLTDPTITNCTFTKNVTDSISALSTFEDGGTISPTILNCIFWDNENAPDFSSLNIASSSTTINFSLVDTDHCDSLGSSVNCGDFMVFQEDPAFVNPGANDFHLGATSAAINTGSNVAVTMAGLLEDLDGANRIVNSIVDLGVYEGTSSCPSILHLADVTINPINYTAAKKVRTNSTVTHMATTELQANECIDLLPGFEVASGATLIVDLNGCGLE